MKAYQALTQLRQTLYGADLSRLSDLELLTALLSYTEPSDPSQLAAAMLEEKGSLQNLFLLEEDALRNLGVCANSATLMKMLLPAFGRALASEFHGDEPFDSTSKLGEYFARRFCGIGTEMVYILLLKENLTAIGCYRIAQGSINSANLNIRAVVEMALFKGAAYVAIAHNHPSGSPQPSSADKTTTLNLQAALGSVGIGFLEHIVVANNRYVPILLNSNTIFRDETYHF